MKDSNDTATLNYYDYFDIKKIKLALKNWKLLKKAAYNGNTSAIVILLDIKTALNQCTEKQKQILVDHLIYGINQSELADELNCSQKVIANHCICGIRKISKLLCYKFVHIDEVL